MSETAPTTAPVVSSTDPLLDPDWHRLVDGADCGLFLSPRWLGTVSEVFDLRPVAHLVHDDEGSPLSGLVVADLDDPRGRRIVGFPFCDVAPPVLADPAHLGLLVDALPTETLPVQLRSLEGRDAPLGPGWHTERTALLHLLDTSRDPDEMYHGYSRTTRRRINHSQRSLRFVEATTRAELRAFYELHLRLRKYKHHLLAQPYELFELLWERFVEAGDGALVLGVDPDDRNRVLGGCLLLAEGSALYYKFAAIDLDALDTGVSHGALHEAALLAHRRGYRHLDLGRSELRHHGLVEFKRRFGTRALPIVTRQWLPDPAVGPTCRDVDARLGRLTELLVHPDVPDQVTEAAGSTLYRWFA